MTRHNRRQPMLAESVVAKPGHSRFARLHPKTYLGVHGLVGLAIAAAIVLLVRRDWRHLTVLAVTRGGGEVLNAVLKLVFRRARPSFASEFKAMSWSFPSGHAMDSLIAYGLLAYWLVSRFPRARTAAIVALSILVGAIGYARIYLGVHSLSDVLAGYSAGFIWLTACISGYEFAERRRVGPGGQDEAAPGRTGAER